MKTLSAIQPSLIRIPSPSLDQSEVSPIEVLIEKLGNISRSSSKNLKSSKKHKRRNSRTHEELANTQVGLREIKSRAEKSTLNWGDKNPTNVMIVSKLRDPEVIVIARKVSKWLLQLGLNVLVEDKMRLDPLFGFYDIMETIDSDYSDSEDISNYPQTPDSASSSPIINEKIKKKPKLGFWNAEYCTTEEASEDVDFIITLGGDGTVLFAAWLFQQQADRKSKIPPLIPFNLGSLGFLTVFQFSSFREIIKRVLKRESTDTRMNFRMRFQCKIDRQVLEDDDEKTKLSKQEDDGKIYHILNDVVIDRGPSPYMSQLDLIGNDRLLTVVQADGLVVATPTGSTAYSLSAGGSLVHPDVSAILVTPICPHTLSFRPMLLPDTMELKIKVPESSRSTAFVSFDGRHKVQLWKGDMVTITASTSPIPTVCLQDQSSDWFLGLEKCLNWNKREKQKSLLKEW